MNKSVLVPLLVLAALLNSSCEDRTPSTDSSYGSGVFVLNEGNFGSSNSSLDHWSTEAVLNQKIFLAANQAPPGDVLQSMFIEGDSIGWMVVNNSGKIDRVRLSDQKRTASVTGLTSPRYVLRWDDLLFVTDLFSGQISVVNANTFEVINSIDAGFWTEELILVNDRIYTTAVDGDELIEIDPISQTISRRIPVGREPLDLAYARERIWVLCSGGFGEEKPTLHQIDPVDGVIDTVLTVGDITDYPGELNTSPGSDQALFWLQSGVQRLDLSNLDQNLAIPASGRNLYGLGIDPYRGTLLISDAKDFVSRGTVYQYSTDGILLDSIISGIIPGNFAVLP